jgi:hypothetical protein
MIRWSFDSSLPGSLSNLPRPALILKNREILNNGRRPHNRSRGIGSSSKAYTRPIPTCHSHNHSHVAEITVRAANSSGDVATPTNKELDLLALSYPREIPTRWTLVRPHERQPPKPRNKNTDRKVDATNARSKDTSLRIAPPRKPGLASQRLTLSVLQPLKPNDPLGLLNP